MRLHAGMTGLLVLGLFLGGCAGNQGNPNGAAYANAPGGTLAVTPQWSGPPVAYDPYAPVTAPSFMQTPAQGGTPRP